MAASSAASSLLTLGVHLTNLRRAAHLELARPALNAVSNTATALLVALPAKFAIQNPLQAATLAQNLALLTHLICPLAHLLARAAKQNPEKIVKKPSDLTQARKKALGKYRQPQPADIYSINYLLSATGILISAALARCGNGVEAPLMGALSRLIMITSLWWWADLNLELKRGGCARFESHPRTLQNVGFRLWRLGATALCTMEMGVMLCILLNVARLRPDVAMQCGWYLSLPALVSAAVQKFLPVASGSPWPSCMPWVWTSALNLPRWGFMWQIVGKKCLSLGGWSLWARVGAFAYVLYTLWWCAFPAEALSRRNFRPSLLPDRRPVLTFGSFILSWAHVASPSPGGDALVVLCDKSASQNPIFTPSDIAVGHCFPQFALRRGYEDTVAPRPQPHEGMHLLDLLYSERREGNRTLVEWWKDEPAAYKASYLPPEEWPIRPWEFWEQLDKELGGQGRYSNMSESDKALFAQECFNAPPNPEYVGQRLNVTFVQERASQELASRARVSEASQPWTSATGEGLGLEAGVKPVELVGSENAESMGTRLTDSVRTDRVNPSVEGVISERARRLIAPEGLLEDHE